MLEDHFFLYQKQLPLSAAVSILNLGLNPAYPGTFTWQFSTRFSLLFPLLKFCRSSILDFRSSNSSSEGLKPWQPGISVQSWLVPCLRGWSRMGCFLLSVESSSRGLEPIFSPQLKRQSVSPVGVSLIQGLFLQDMALESSSSMRFLGLPVDWLRRASLESLADWFKVLLRSAGLQMLPWQLVFQCSVPVLRRLKPFLQAVSPAFSASSWSQALVRELPAKLRVELLPRWTCSGWQSWGSVFSRWAFLQMEWQWLQLSRGLILSASRRVDDQISFFSCSSLPCLSVGQGCSEQLLCPPYPTTLFIMEVIQILCFIVASISIKAQDSFPQQFGMLCINSGYGDDGPSSLHSGE